MTTYYIDPANGDNANNGTSTDSALKDFETLENNGGNELTSGDVVKVMDTAEVDQTASSVDFFGITGTRTDPIVIEPYQNDSPVVNFNNNGDHGFKMAGCQYFHFKGLEVKNPDNNAFFVKSSAGASADHNVFENLDIHNFAGGGSNGDGLQFGDGNGNGCHNNFVLDCYIHHSDTANNASDGVKITNHAQAHVYNCTIEVVADDGIDCIRADPNNRPRIFNTHVRKAGYYDDAGSETDSGAPGYGFKAAGDYTDGDGASMVYHCTAAECGQEGFTTQIGSNTTVIANCTAYNNEDTGFKVNDDGTGNTHIIRNNLADSNTNGAFSDMSGGDDQFNSWNLADYTAPSFRSTNWDSDQYLRIQSGSDARDAGDPQHKEGQVGYHIDWTGKAPDLGAYQYYDAASRPQSVARIEKYTEVEATSQFIVRDPNGDRYSVEVDTSGSLTTNGPL